METHNCERERERELRELRGFDRERSAHKKALLEILWCDDYQDSLHGVWNSGTTWKPPPKRKFHTKSIQRIPEQIVGIGGDFHSQDDNDKVKTTLYKVRLSGYDRTGGTWELITHLQGCTSMGTFLPLIDVWWDFQYHPFCRILDNELCALLYRTKITVELDRLIVLSKSSLLGWFLHVSLILIIKERYPREVSLIVIIKEVSVWLSLIIKLFHHFSPNLSKSTHDSPDQTDDRI